jgi:MerR family transcriptional regulator, light-induced transcriptional regulator
MANYSIKDLEKISGIKAHTIRIWEQRYDLLTPVRSETNIRSYNDDQALKLLNVSILIQSGYKISEVAKLATEEISKKLDTVYKDQNQHDSKHFIQINHIIKATLIYDQASFESEFLTALIKYGFEGTFENILYPVLNKIGQLWTKDQLNPSQEHFLINLIKQKLYAEIEKTPLPINPVKKFVLFLPEWEDHEIGLLYGNYLLKKNSLMVTFLGSKVPAHNLVNTIATVKPHYLLTFLSAAITNKTLNSYFSELLNFSETKILVSGNYGIIRHLESNDKIEFLKTVDSFKNFINTV